LIWMALKPVKISLESGGWLNSRLRFSQRGLGRD
jgi:hypothetical protein